MTLPGWTQSIRAWSVLIILCGITAGLFLTRITAENYMQVALIVITAYFSKRDVGEENSRTSSTTEKTSTTVTGDDKLPE